MPLARCSLMVATILLASCDSKITSRTDQNLLNKIQTVTDCFPGLYSKIDGLLDLADTWRMNRSGSAPALDGVLSTITVGGSGQLSFSYTFNSCTLAMTIRFFSPTGAEQNLNLTGASSLADKVDLAATTLRTNFPAGNPFMVGSWTISGTKGGDPVTGSGALTGIIGGSTNGNELEELRTTASTPSGGPPAVADSTISEGSCAMTFRVTSLVTDGSPTQQYPIGSIALSITDPQSTVAATITFDDTAVVRVTITGVPGRFDFNVETRTLTQVP